MKIDPVTREEWEKLYDPMHSAFQSLVLWHMMNSANPEEMQARIVMDLSITVVNLFLVNDITITEAELHRECQNFIENMKRCLTQGEIGRFTRYRGGEKATGAALEEHTFDPADTSGEAGQL